MHTPIQERQDTALPSAFLAVAVLLAVWCVSKGYFLTFSVLCAVAAISLNEWHLARGRNQEHGTD